LIKIKVKKDQESFSKAMNYQSFFIFFNQESCVIRTGYSNTKSSESENSGDFTAVRLTESCVLK